MTSIFLCCLVPAEVRKGEVSVVEEGKSVKTLLQWDPQEVTVKEGDGSLTEHDGMYVNEE